MLELRGDDDQRAGREAFVIGPFGGADGARPFEDTSFAEAVTSEEDIYVGKEVNKCPVQKC